MTPMQMKISVWMIMFGLVLTAFSTIGLLLYIYGPCVEPFVAGYVIKIPQPDHVWRGYIAKRETHREVEVGCFRYHGLRKLAAAIPDRYVFQVETRLSDKINVSAYVAGDDHQRSQDDLSTHAPGMVWDRSYCFEMPGTIADDQDIRVTGHAEHTRLAFGKPLPWLSITPVPEFVMMPESCYRANGSFDGNAKDCRGM